MKNSEDGRISHQDGIPIANSYVQTSDTLLHDQRSCSVHKVAAVDRNKQGNYSSKRV